MHLQLRKAGLRLYYIRRASSDADVKDCDYLGDIRDDSVRDLVKKVVRLGGDTIVELVDEDRRKWLTDGPKFVNVLGANMVFTKAQIIARVYRCRYPERFTVPS